MCEPGTIAMISTALATAGSVAGSVVQAQGIKQQSEAAASAEERRAELAERQMEINQTQGSFERKRTLEQYRRVIGYNRAAGAERGLSETGSVTDVADDNAYETAQNIEAIRYRIDGQRDNLTFEANTARERAASYRQSGRIGAFGAILGGATSALTTLGKTAYQRAQA